MNAPKKTPAICWFSDDETPNKIITRDRAAYILRAARSRNSKIVNRRPHAYIVKDTTALITLV